MSWRVVRYSKKIYIYNDKQSICWQKHNEKFYGPISAADVTDANLWQDKSFHITVIGMFAFDKCPAFWRH